jgi:hypothetical protein
MVVSDPISTNYLNRRILALNDSTYRRTDAILVTEVRQVAEPVEPKERKSNMAKNNVNIPTVEEIGDWVTVKKAAELMGVELPSVWAIIHDGCVKACRIAGVFLVDKASATEFGKKRQAEAARKAREEKLAKLANLTEEQLAKLLAQVEGEAAEGTADEVADQAK